MYVERSLKLAVSIMKTRPYYIEIIIIKKLHFFQKKVFIDFYLPSFNVALFYSDLEMMSYWETFYLNTGHTGVIASQTVMIRTSSVGKVDYSKSRGPRFESHNKPSKEKSACALGQGTLQGQGFPGNDALPFLDYEHGMLKDLIVTFESIYEIKMYKLYKPFHSSRSHFETGLSNPNSGIKPTCEL